MVHDLVHVAPSKPRGRLAHEGHHEVHALGAHAPHHVVRDVEELAGRVSAEASREIDKTRDTEREDSER